MPIPALAILGIASAGLQLGDSIYQAKTAKEIAQQQAEKRKAQAALALKLGIVGAVVVLIVSYFAFTKE